MRRQEQVPNGKDEKSSQEFSETKKSNISDTESEVMVIPETNVTLYLTWNLNKVTVIKVLRLEKRVDKLRMSTKRKY